MSDNQSWHLDLLAITRVTTCTYVQLHKIKHFHAYYSFLSCQAIEANLLEKKPLARFELASSIIRVLDLGHYTVTDDIVILLPL